MMHWLPPRSIREREQWAKAHPWIAGVYFGLMFWAVFPLLALLDSKISLKWAYLFGLAMLPVTAVLFSVGLKRRWGSDPTRESAPFSMWRRPWSTASDRFLLWFQWLGVAGIASSIGEFFGKTVRPWGAVVGLLCACWIASTTWVERRRRRPVA
ncbi:MAG TPA: hypothetical protein VGB19_12270 [Actinomycetota bacterium]|nr:hypothetical protein [Actinomycetota bacterium]